MWVVLVILVGFAVAGTDATHHTVPSAVLVIAVVLAVGTSLPAARWLRPYVESVLWSHVDGPPSMWGSVGPVLDGDLPSQLSAQIARQLRLPYVAILRPGEAPAAGVDTSRLAHLELTFGGELLGELVAAPRGRDRALAASDRVGLDEVATQIAIVMHAEHARGQVERSRAAVITTREEERRRIRNDLHDGLGPTLASLGLHLAALARLIPQHSDQAMEMVEGLRGEVRSTSALVRELIYDLRPPMLDDVGLPAALRHHAAEVSGDAGVDVAVAIVGDLAGLPAAVEVAIYRISGEALANVRRHAQAHRAAVCLTTDSQSVLLRIEDDGRGLPPRLQPGVGLTSMRDRAEELQGTFAIVSLEDGPGTRVEVRLPLRST